MPPVWSRVARWYIFIPKMQILVYFGRPWIEKFGVLHTWPFGTFIAIVVYIHMCIYILWLFSIFVAILVHLVHFGLLHPKKSGNTDVKKNEGRFTYNVLGLDNSCGTYFIKSNIKIPHEALIFIYQYVLIRRKCIQGLYLESCSN
jgi:hypothetical protein